MLKAEVPERKTVLALQLPACLRETLDGDGAASIVTSLGTIPEKVIVILKTSAGSSVEKGEVGAREDEKACTCAGTRVTIKVEPLSVTGARQSSQATLQLRSDLTDFAGISTA